MYIRILRAQSCSCVVRGVEVDAQAGPRCCGSIILDAGVDAGGQAGSIALRNDASLVVRRALQLPGIIPRGDIEETVVCVALSNCRYRKRRGLSRQEL